MIQLLSNCPHGYRQRCVQCDVKKTGWIAFYKYSSARPPVLHVDITCSQDEFFPLLEKIRAAGIPSRDGVKFIIVSDTTDWKLDFLATEPKEILAAFVALRLGGTT